MQAFHRNIFWRARAGVSIKIANETCLQSFGSWLTLGRELETSTSPKKYAYFFGFLDDDALAFAFGSLALFFRLGDDFVNSPKTFTAVARVAKVWLTRSSLTWATHPQYVSTRYLLNVFIWSNYCQIQKRYT